MVITGFRCTPLQAALLLGVASASSSPIQQVGEEVGPLTIWTSAAAVFRWSVDTGQFFSGYICGTLVAYGVALLFACVDNRLVYVPRVGVVSA